MTVKAHILNFWNGMRHLTGEDAYERYLAHWQAEHGDKSANGDAEAATPLDRKAFFQRHQDEEWQKINRCC
mgnify:CR=1 FL=1